MSSTRTRHLQDVVASCRTESARSKNCDLCLTHVRSGVCGCNGLHTLVALPLHLSTLCISRGSGMFWFGSFTGGERNSVRCFLEKYRFWFYLAAFNSVPPRPSRGDFLSFELLCHDRLSSPQMKEIPQSKRMPRDSLDREPPRIFSIAATPLSPRNTSG